MEIAALLEDWQIGVRIFHVAHSKAASYYSRQHKLFGVVVIALTTIVGTTTFTSLETSLSTSAQILVGMVSVTAVVFASLQTFLNYDGIAEKHRVAALKYGALRRKLETSLAMDPADTAALNQFAESFRKEWDTIDSEGQILPQRFYDIAAAQVGHSMEAARIRVLNKEPERQTEPALRED